MNWPFILAVIHNVINWPVILTCVLAFFALAGVVGLALTTVFWNSVGRAVGDVWPKVVAGVVKFLAGIAAVGGAYAAAADKQEWWFPAVCGVVCLLLWELLEKLIDGRVKAADRVNKSALATAQAATAAAVEECETQTELLALFRQSAVEKSRRLRRQLARRKKKPSATLLRAALTPEDHLAHLLQLLVAFFAEQNPDGQAGTNNFRVGLYAARQGVMTPLRAVDPNNPGYDVFTSTASTSQPSDSTPLSLPMWSPA